MIYEYEAFQQAEFDYWTINIEISTGKTKHPILGEEKDGKGTQHTCPKTTNHLYKSPMHHCTICKLRSWFNPLSSLNLPNLSGHFAIHGELKFHLCGSDERSKAGPNPRAGRIGSAAHELKTVPGEINVKLFGNHREVGNHWEITGNGLVYRELLCR